jgi:hypothetical protein
MTSLCADMVGHLEEHDRRGRAEPLKVVRLAVDDERMTSGLNATRVDARKVDISAVPSIFGLQILALTPTQFMELLLEY